MQVSPKVLQFQAPFTEVQTQDVSVTNETNDYIAFKVKTTAPKLYCVRPNASTIAPKESVNVHIILQGLEQEPAVGTKCKDKFLFVSVPCDASVSPRSVSKAWPELQKAAGGTSKGIKMKVSFKYDNAIKPIEEENSSEISNGAAVTSSAAKGATESTTTSRHVEKSAGNEQKSAGSKLDASEKSDVAATEPPVVAPKSGKSINSYLSFVLLVLFVYVIIKFVL
mgnify:CR=1 FL=1